MFRRLRNREANGGIVARRAMDEGGGEMSLSDARVGGLYRLAGLVGGHSFREKISSMGLSSGVTFRVISNSGNGPVGLEVGNTKLGIGRGMAERIMVKEIEAE